jgi:hypothetical protein
MQDYGSMTDRLMAYRTPQGSGTAPPDVGGTMGLPGTTRTAQMSSDTLSPPQMTPQPSPLQQQRQMTPLSGNNATPWAPYGGFGGDVASPPSALMFGTQQGFQPQQQPQQQQPQQPVMGGGLADRFKGERGAYAAGRWARNRPLGR